jgi:hypothetical protein
MDVIILGDVVQTYSSPPFAITFNLNSMYLIQDEKSYPQMSQIFADFVLNHD